MQLDTIPQLTDEEEAAVRRAFALVRIQIDGAPAAYASAWGRAAAREAVDAELAGARYAPSPRRTRGATRA